LLRGDRYGALILLVIAYMLIIAAADALRCRLIADATLLYSAMLLLPAAAATLPLMLLFISLIFRCR